MEVIRRKIRRLATGQPPRVLDLFAGCGGLSLGFHSAGCRITAAVEKDIGTAASHGRNFHRGKPAHARPRDATNPPEELARALNLGQLDRAFDIVIGSPPCQPFARIGRAKLSEVEKNPDAFLQDPRVTLVRHWLEYVVRCRPLAVLMENVPDIMNHGRRNVAQETCTALEAHGYRAAYTILNAALYGVPQMRDRMFLLAYRKEITETVRFPEPTHQVDLPTGYVQSRNVALKWLNRETSPGPTGHYVEPPGASDQSPQAVTAREAIEDLPPIFALAEVDSGMLRRGAKRLDVEKDYTRNENASAYAKSMQAWPDFEGTRSLYDHVIRYVPRDYRLFAQMKSGDQYPEAYRLAVKLFEAELERWRGQGLAVQPDSDGYRSLKRLFVPSNDPGKFPNRWRKMSPDEPARTLMAHLGKDSYNHIHYDSAQARTISVREAARLQSFPDGFQFRGSMNSAFRQIGNAVPPILAMRLAEQIGRVLGECFTESDI